MRLALIADWLPTFGGAEHVIAEFRSLYPEAPLYTTVAKRGHIGPLDATEIHTTRLQKLYNITRNHQILLPLMPRAMEDIDVRGYDVLLSSSHAVGKGIVPESSTLHICYCHTPVRYAWDMEDDYLRDFSIPKFLQPFIRRKLMKLREWDLTTAQRTDIFIANSSETQERIKRIYNRQSVVIPPPVDDHFFGTALRASVHGSPYLLAVGRLVPYKRFDLLIRVANALQLPLKIAGTGQDEKRLRALAGTTVEFLGFVPDQKLPELYSEADALLFPQYEDAGIVIREAQATGTPVIAYDAGGARDVVKDGETGILFAEQTEESLRDAIERMQQTKWNRSQIREHARVFSRELFQKEITKTVEENYTLFKKGEFRRI